MAEGEGDLLPGCGWTPLTASLTASRAYRHRHNLSYSTQSRPVLKPHVIQNMLMSMLNTRGHVLFDGFCMAPSRLLLAVIGQQQQGDSVELGAPVMIRQQNVSLRVKPCFDQFSSPLSVSSSGRNG